MSNAIQTEALLEAIREAVQTAMGWDVSVPVAYGQPQTPQSVPYAVIKPAGVDIAFGGRAGTVQGMNQENVFDILIRKAWPDDPKQLIILQQIADANAVIAQLQTGPGFAAIAIFPLVTQVVYLDPDADNRIFATQLSFTCVTIADHH